MWVVFCWKDSRHCLQYRRIHTLHYSFPVRQYQLGFQITWYILHRKIAIFLVASELRPRWRPKKNDEHPILLKCNKCSKTCTRKVQSHLHLQSQHNEHQKNKWSIKKSHKTFCQYFADEQIDWLKLLHGN